MNHGIHQDRPSLSQNAIDLLRNQGPLYLLYSCSGGGFENGIKTTDEVVGDR
jgi:hypothetical protein